MKIHHMGYLVKNMKASVREFEILGFFIIKEIYKDNDRMCDFCFMQKEGYTIELVAPWSDESSMYPLLKHHKNVAYHLCYEVESIEDEIDSFVQKGYMLIKPVERALAISPLGKVAFLMHKDIGMIELLEQ